MTVCRLHFCHATGDSGEPLIRWRWAPVQGLCGAGGLMLDPRAVSLVLGLAESSLERYLRACKALLWWSLGQGAKLGSGFINASALTPEIWLGGDRSASSSRYRQLDFRQ